MNFIHTRRQRDAIDRRSRAQVTLGGKSVSGLLKIRYLEARNKRHMHVHPVSLGNPKLQQPEFPWSENRMEQPPPWTIDEMNDACFIVRDKNGLALGYFYFEEEPGRRAGR